MATQYDTIKSFVAWIAANYPTFASGQEFVTSYINTASNPPTLTTPTGGDPIVEMLFAEIVGNYNAASVLNNLQLSNAQVKELWTDWLFRLSEISTLWTNLTTALTTYVGTLPT